MKKNILLVLLSALLVTGCSYDKGDLRDPDGEGGGGGDNPPPAGDVTKTFSTSTDALSQIFGARVGFVGSNNASNVENLENSFRTTAGNDDCLKSLGFTGYVQTLDCGDHANEVYLCLGSRNSSGTMKWNSIAKITKVEFTVLNYYKTFDYEPYVSLDSNAAFKIDSDTHSLAMTETVAPTKQTFSKEYADGTTSFTVSSDSGRVLIDSFKITWTL